MSKERIAGPWKKAAAHMWNADGRPQFHIMEPGSVGRHHYDRWARDTLKALRALGYTVRRTSK